MSGFEASPPSPPPSSVAVDFSSFGLPFTDGQQGLYLLTEGPFSPKSDSQGVPKGSDDASSPLSPLVASAVGFHRHRNYGHAGDAMLSAIDYSEHDILQEGGFDVSFGHLEGLLRLPPQHGGPPSDAHFDLLNDAELQLSPHTFSAVDNNSALGSVSDGQQEAERQMQAAQSSSCATPVATILQSDGNKESEEKLQTVQVALQQLGPRPALKQGHTLGNGRGPSTQPCPICGKVFANSSALTKHKLTHSDERKYVCHLCNKAFKRQDHLNGHMLTHRNKKPYQCDVEGCDKSYCDARSLRRHKENHHASVALTLLPFQAIPLPPKLQLVAFPAAKDRHLGSSPQWTTHQGPLLLAPKAPMLPTVIPTSKEQSQPSIKTETPDPDHTQALSAPPKETAPLLQRLLDSTPDVKKTWTTQVSFVKAAPVNHVVSTPTSDTGPVETAVSSNVCEQKLVECSLCQRKFKNTPALNGHMRLHGGYFKKEPADGGERRVSETPLQTASVGVRALLEEVVTQRRAAMREASPTEDAVFTDEPLPSLSEWARPFRVPKAPAPRRHSDSDHLAYDDNGLLADLLLRQRRTSRIGSDPGFEPLPAFAELQDLGDISEKGNETGEVPESARSKQMDDHGELSLFDGGQEADFLNLPDPFHEEPQRAEARRAEGLCDAFHEEVQRDASPQAFRGMPEAGQVDGSCRELGDCMTSVLPPATCPSNFMEPSRDTNHSMTSYTSQGSATLSVQGPVLLVQRCSPTPPREPRVSTAECSVPDFVPPSLSRRSPVLVHCHSSASHSGATPSVATLSTVAPTAISHLQTSMPMSSLTSVQTPVLVSHSSLAPTSSFVVTSLHAAEHPLVSSVAVVSPTRVTNALPAESVVQEQAPNYEQSRQEHPPDHRTTSPDDGCATPPKENACPPLKSAPEDNVQSSAATQKPATQEFDDDDVFLSPIPSSPLRARRKHRPEPLYIPPHVNAIGFPSRLRSPRLWDPAVDVSGPKSGMSPPPYTPPPMLSPVRSGSGLFWHILSGGPRSAGLVPTAPQTVPSTPRAENITEVLSEEDEETVPETDILPHVNIGSQFQARLPPVDKAKALEAEHKADMVWNPEICDQLLDEEVEAYLEFACCAAVVGGGRNKEYAMHVLALCQGNIQEATMWLMDQHPRLPPGHPLLSYRYSECHRWSREEIELYQEALNVFDKDFFNVAAKVGSKSVKQCVEFYYVWKKVSPDEYRRLRCLRRRREQDGLLQSQEDTPATGPQGASPSGTSQDSSPASAAPAAPTKTVEQPPPAPQQDFPCKLCGRVFAKVKSRNAHMKSHGPPKIASKFEF